MIFNEFSYYYLTLEEIENGAVNQILKSGMVENGYELVARDISICIEDKNKKEIYENDILKYKDNLGDIKKVVVKWQYYEMMNNGWFNTIIMEGPLTIPKNCEIIGNIHENIGLLNENS